MTNLNPNNTKSNTYDYDLHVSGLSKLIDFSGDMYILDEISYNQNDNEENNIFEGISCQKDGAIKKNRIKIGEKNPTYFDTVLLITFNNGNKIYVTEKSNLLTSCGSAEKIENLTTGNSIQSGTIRYDNNEWIPNVVFQLNHILEIKKVSGHNIPFYKIHTNSDNIFIGQESDGETQFICLS